jgi:hypothetical protein
MQSFEGYNYTAFGDNGEYVREAQTIDELPTIELRTAAINKAKIVLNMNVLFGVKLGYSNRFTHSEIKNDKTGLLSKRGCDLPLSIFRQ